ncbi:FkbM family methyltransferase [Amycolatopsis sp. NPDC088138]|uniref:FkbM family methyltransferase n=1 Tax=Amycolatopsis sp. NPDC088138 TaxID=3363938 RepID=UPI00380B74B1
MISYAQQAEDVVLARVFAGQADGRYVDIGAGDPLVASVTKHFYDLGWRGINIEPIPAKARELRTARPGDLTLDVAVGARPGTAKLHVVENEWGWSTLDDELAVRYRDDNGWRVSTVEVELSTLAAVLDEHPGAVDFLKIDVEGAERAVIEGADWTRHRPRVLVVEATEPGAQTQTHQEWEPMLLDAGYQCGLFDGLNRFYARSDDAEALSRLSAPANVFDEFERYDVLQQAKALEELRAGRAAEIGYARRIEGELRELQETHRRAADYLEQLEQTRAEQERQRTRGARYTAGLEARVAELEALLAAASGRIAELEARRG